MAKNSFNQKEFDVLVDKLLTDKHLNQALMDSLPYPAMLISKERRIVTSNKAAQDIGIVAGSFCWDTFGQKASISQEDKEYYEKNNEVPDKGIKCTFCKADDSLEAQEPVNEKIPAGDITYDTFWIPLNEDIYLHYAIVIS